MTSSVRYIDYTCENSYCEYSTTGICAKNHVVADNCPFLTLDHDTEDEELEGEDTNTEESDLLGAHDTDEDEEDDGNLNLVSDSVFFAPGEAIPESNIEIITYAFPTKLVLIIGGPYCGKTTLVSAIFESFQKGPLGDFIFAGSQTQVGFEKISYLAREASGRVDPDTERTKSPDFFHLHLAIRNKSLDKEAQHILFTDVSGERFTLARDSQLEMNGLTILQKADHIFYMVNGELLSNIETRATTKQDVIIFLKRAIQSNLISKNKKIILLINKYDRVIKNSAEQSVESFFTNPIRQNFSEIIDDIIPTVARPKRDSLSNKTLNLDVFLKKSTNNKETILYEKNTLSTRLREFSLLFSL